MIEFTLIGEHALMFKADDATFIDHSEKRDASNTIALCYFRTETEGPVQCPVEGFLHIELPLFHVLIFRTRIFTDNDETILGYDIVKCVESRMTVTTPLS